MKQFAIAFFIGLAGSVSPAIGQNTVPPALIVPAGSAPAAKPADEKPTPIYDEKADVKVLIADALVKAKKENLRVLVQWGGNWCGWCTRLHGLYKSDKDIAKKLLYEYVVVYADSGRPDDKNISLAESYGADLMKHGFPYLTILDADGKVLANQDTGSLEIKGASEAPWHDPKLVLKFLTDHQASYQDAQELLDHGLAQASETGKRVFLHFGAPWCGWCHKLEDWMDRADIKPVLSKDFVDVKIDVDRTIGGKELMTKFKADAKGGIPWFAFLDSTGNVLANSNGEKGNIGFPAQPDEIAHFQKMLGKAAVNLKSDQINVLAESLAAKPKKTD